MISLHWRRMCGRLVPSVHIRVYSLFLHVYSTSIGLFRLCWRSWSLVSCAVPRLYSGDEVTSRITVGKSVSASCLQSGVRSRSAPRTWPQTEQIRFNIQHQRCSVEYFNKLYRFSISSCNRFHTFKKYLALKTCTYLIYNVQGVSKRALQWYSKCYCVASVKKILYLKAVRLLALRTGRSRLPRNFSVSGTRLS
jgi:hypothetical protein